MRILREDGEDGEAFEDFAATQQQAAAAGITAQLRQRLRAWVLPALAKWARANARSVRARRRPSRSRRHASASASPRSPVSTRSAQMPAGGAPARRPPRALRGTPTHRDLRRAGTSAASDAWDLDQHLVAADLERQVAHWLAAARTFRDAEEFASLEAWKSVERDIGAPLRQQHAMPSSRNSSRSAKRRSALVADGAARIRPPAAGRRRASSGSAAATSRSTPRWISSATR